MSVVDTSQAIRASCGTWHDSMSVYVARKLPGKNGISSSKQFCSQRLSLFSPHCGADAQLLLVNPTSTVFQENANRAASVCWDAKAFHGDGTFVFI